jgi:glutamate-5-semialdehyde dehydrogenase
MSIEALAKRSRQASRVLAISSRSEKDAALLAMAQALIADAQQILDANEVDVAAALAEGATAASIDRMSMTNERIAGMSEGLRQVASLADPVGEVIRSSRTSDGLLLEQVRVPFGVIGIVYEARPNVTVDAAGICLKSGNAVLLRGSSSTANTDAVLIAVMRSAIERAGLPADLVIQVPSEDRETVRELLTARGLVDLVIPRGGASLIELVVSQATVPVIETGVGNCHIFVDEQADPAKALPIIINAKTSRPSVCNAAETLLVHQGIASDFLPVVLAQLVDAGVTIHGDEEVSKVGTEMRIDVLQAQEEDWYREYGSLDLAVAVVPDLDAAIDHIRTYGSGHTEAIVTESSDSARRFVAGCDSAAVMINASTRFTDGEMFGFGAEIGISTQKLHARGPMALPEMTTTTWIVTGEGQIRA